MIDTSTDYIYNIILSIILGIVVILIIHQMFIYPRIIEIDNKQNKNKNKNKNKN